MTANQNGRLSIRSSKTTLTLPDTLVSGSPIPTGTCPFVGKSIEDAANFIRNAPKPPKPLSKRFFAVLQKEFYEQSNRMLICRISTGDDAEDGLEGDENNAEGLRSFKEEGRSLMCKISPDVQQCTTSDD
jgi:hypothetical protein